jgi:hypothetical protein
VWEQSRANIKLTRIISIDLRCKIITKNPQICSTVQNKILRI